MTSPESTVAKHLLKQRVFSNGQAQAFGTVLAVIVTYNPELPVLAQSVKTLHQQGCGVLLVDNASVNQVELKSADIDATLLCNEQNLGLGAAHNQGFEHAKKAGYQYLLILDQDSQPLESMVAELVLAHQSLAQYEPVSAVGACYLNADNASESFFVRFGAWKFQREYATEQVVKADFLISSGSLFAIEALQTIGGMDEGLFIDHVDTEWFLRARDKGYQAYGIGRARMQHGLGEQTHQVNLGGRLRNVPQHKPFRYYYIFRNSIALYKRGYTSWLWKWNDVQRLAMIFVMFGLLKAPRWQNMHMMLLGLWHGVIGKTGATQLENLR